MNHGILVGAGFLLGTLGVKALKSEPVRKAAVATVAQGLKVKEEAGLTSRCMPDEQKHIGDVCPICGKPAKHSIIWGKAY